MKHSCIKNCGTIYESEDPEAYYCPNCLSTRAQIVRELSQKYNTVGQVPHSALTEYEASARIITTPDGRKVSFAPAKL